MHILKYILLPKIYKKAILIALDATYQTYIEIKYPEVKKKLIEKKKENW